MKLFVKKKEGNKRRKIHLFIFISCIYLFILLQGKNYNKIIILFYFIGKNEKNLEKVFNNALCACMHKLLQNNIFLMLPIHHRCSKTVEFCLFV